ncbi:MAG TPA: site-specific integrase [Ignavibacteria bacterium]|nr:site-specific integrase [Ignavibacteria bacterium]
MKPGKYRINFLLEQRKDKSTVLITENVPINAVITFAGNRLVYYIDYRIDFTKWDLDKQQVKTNNFNKAGDSASIINRRIADIRTVVSDIFRHYENLRTFPTIPQVRAEIRNRLNEKINHVKHKENTLLARFEQYIKDVEVSPLRRKQIESCKNHLERFDSKVTFESLNIDSFKKHLIKDTGEKGNKKKSLNTIAGILKKLKAFISYARIKEWTKLNPFQNYSIDSEKYGEPVYITREERDMLFNAEIDNERLSRTMDIFILQCLIGARIGDFVKLTKDNIVNDAIEYVPSKSVNKSFRKVRIPLSDKAKAIINKYNIPDGSLVPYISQQKYNDNLKDLFRLDNIKLTRPVVRLNPLTRKNEVIPLSELASSHMARRTFIGLLHKTTKNEVIASMSGHVNDSRAFSRYYRIDEEQQGEAIESID